MKYANLKVCSHNQQKGISCARLVPFSWVLFSSSSKAAVWKHIHEKLAR